MAGERSDRTVYLRVLGPLAVAAIKHQVYADWCRDLRAAYDDASRRMDDAIGGHDFRLAIRALSKRESPEFPGWSAPTGWSETVAR